MQLLRSGRKSHEEEVNMNAHRIAGFSVRSAGYALCACVTASGCGHQIRPDDMSAEAHLAAAREETKEARRETAMARNESPGQDPLAAGIEPELYINPDANSNLTEERTLRARFLERRARQHEQAAAELERFEEAQCGDIPPPERGVCPSLGSIADARDISGGVRVRLNEQAGSSEVLPQVRCHYAYERAHGFSDRQICPLSVRGVEFRATGDLRVFDVLGKDAKTVGEIRRQIHGGGLGPIGMSGS
jgi:hypothetical protein